MHPALAEGAPIRRIAVFRALVLGDMLCATPALRAIRAAWPDAELTLIGLPWAAGFAARLPSVDRFEAFPGHPELPEIEPDLGALPGFIERMRDSRFDLAIQLHGSGSIVNPLVASFGARHVAGFADSAGESSEPALHTRWPRTGHEIERMLALVDHLGLERRGTGLDFGVSDADRGAFARTVPELANAGGTPTRGAGAKREITDPDAPIVCVHPGAQLPSRRWPSERFAAVADALVAAGARVVLTGSAGEAAVTGEVRRQMRSPALDLAGRTDLFGLGALVERARLVVCNDTGVMHVAAALGTPSVAVSSGAEVARWAPLDAARHRVLWHDVPCRPCAFRVCPLPGHDCARGVSVADVTEAALEALARESADAC